MEKALFLRKFDVTFWALEYVFGKDTNYWYRIEQNLGHNSIVGTTVKKPELLPEHLIADEKHTWVGGKKAYVATTAANEVFLGSSVVPNADEEHSCNKKSFSQNVRRLYEWSQNQQVPESLRKIISKLKTNRDSYATAYDHKNAYRTSNMLDRLMQRMDRHLFSIQYFHGTLETSELNIRACALIYNFAPSNPNTVIKYNSFKSPAERLNQHSYHQVWLQNLLVSASLGGF